MASAEMQHVAACSNGESTGSVIANLSCQPLRGPRQSRCAAEINARQANDFIVELLDSGEVVQRPPASDKLHSRSIGWQLRNFVEPGCLVRYSSRYSHKRECPLTDSRVPVPRTRTICIPFALLLPKQLLDIPQRVRFQNRRSEVAKGCLRSSQNVGSG